MEIDEQDSPFPVNAEKFPAMTSCASTHVGKLCSQSCRVMAHGLLTLDLVPDLDAPDFSAGKVSAEKIRHHIRS